LTIPIKLINRNLQEDNASGVLSSDDVKEILTFPGRRAAASWTCSIGGRRALVPVLLESGRDVYYTCVASRDTAKQLAVHLFTTQVRVYGTGRMTRDALAAGDKRGSAQGTWAKVKYDRQSVAIAKVDAADTIHSDDSDVRKLAVQAGLSVMGIAELPLPREMAQGHLNFETL
jgi:hypothetical protein